MDYIPAIMSSKTDILFVNGHLNVGGVERSLIDTLKHLDYDKFNVDLLLLEDLGNYACEVPKQVNIILKDTRAAVDAALYEHTVDRGIRYIRSHNTDG